MFAPEENGDGRRDVKVVKVKLLLIGDVPDEHRLMHQVHSFCILKNIKKTSPPLYLIGDVPDEDKPRTAESHHTNVEEKKEKPRHVFRHWRAKCELYLFAGSNCICHPLSFLYL